MKAQIDHFGIREPLPLRGFPAGKVRIRQRNTEFPTAVVKTDTGARRFIIGEHEGHWVPMGEMGANARA